MVQLDDFKAFLSAPSQRTTRADSLEMERVLHVFATFNADRNGSVNPQEIVCAMGALGFCYPLPLLV
jgi:hypothetical protein